MAIALVTGQSVQKDAASATSTTISFPVATTANNLVAVMVRVGGTSTAAITDDAASGGNTYNTDKSQFLSGAGTLYIFTAPNAKATTVITVTLTGGSATIRIAIAEYSGVATSAPLDQTNVATGSSTAPNSGNVTPGQNNELLIGAVANANGSAWTSPSLTSQQEVPTGGGSKLIFMDQIQTTATTRAASVSISSQGWIAMIATYNPASSFTAKKNVAAFQAVSRASYW